VKGDVSMKMLMRDMENPDMEYYEEDVFKRGDIIRMCKDINTFAIDL